MPFYFLQTERFFGEKRWERKARRAVNFCFNTGMSGYQEIYTDPSYFGQIVVHTMAHIGNYGVKSEETESDAVKISGMVCSGFSSIYSRIGAEDNLDNYLAENGIVGIAEIDTRKLVLHIRHKGAMNAVISSEILEIGSLKEELHKVPDMESLELASKVMTQRPYQVGPEDGKRVALLDFGIKRNMPAQLALHGFNCMVLPGNSTVEEIMAFEPGGFFFSNGPGDPGSMDEAVGTIRTLIDTGKPFFGICLGTN